MRRRRVLAAAGLSALGGCLRLTATEEAGTETVGGSGTTGATTDDASSAGDATTTDSMPEPLSVDSTWQWLERPSTTALGDDALYVGTTDGVTALDLESGDELWTVTTDPSIGAVAPTDDGVIAVGGVSGDDEETGVVLALGPNGVENRADTPYSLSRLAVGDGAAFAGVYGTTSEREGPTLFAFELDGLDERWTESQFATDSVGGIAVADGTALVGYANHFASYAVDDGSRGTSTDWGVDGSPLVAEGTAYLSTHGGLRAVDVESGIEQWTFESDSLHTAPTLADGTLYAGGWDGLYAVERDGSNGRQLVDTGEETYVTTPPAFHAGYVWILTVDDRLLAVEPTHEQVLFETQLDGRGQWLAGSGDRLYVEHRRAVEAFTVETP